MISSVRLDCCINLPPHEMLNLTKVCRQSRNHSGGSNHLTNCTTCSNMHKLRISSQLHICITSSCGPQPLEISHAFLQAHQTGRSLFEEAKRFHTNTEIPTAAIVQLYTCSTSTDKSNKGALTQIVEGLPNQMNSSQQATTVKRSQPSGDIFSRTPMQKHYCELQSPGINTIQTQIGAKDSVNLHRFQSELCKTNSPRRLEKGQRHLMTKEKMSLHTVLET